MMQHFQYQIEFNEEKDLEELESVKPQTLTESKPGPSGQSYINNDEYIDHLIQYQKELNSDNEDENKENINQQNIFKKPQLNKFQPEVKGKGKGKGKKSGKLYSEHFPAKEYLTINVPVKIEKLMPKFVEFNIKNGDQHWITNDNFEKLRLLFDYGVKLDEEVFFSISENKHYIL